MNSAMRRELGRRNGRGLGQYNEAAEQGPSAAATEQAATAAIADSSKIFGLTPLQLGLVAVGLWLVFGRK